MLQKYTPLYRRKTIKILILSSTHGYQTPAPHSCKPYIPHPAQRYLICTYQLAFGFGYKAQVFLALLRRLCVDMVGGRTTRKAKIFIGISRRDLAPANDCGRGNE